MSFDVSADAYARFMGRYSEPLAMYFVELLGLRRGQRALDVGCGPGALTAELVERAGAGAVSAVDPSERFVAALGSRFRGIDVHCATAERLPFEDDTFDVTAAQLVVHFMADPVAGLAEMARVTVPGGMVAACVWDHAGGSGPLSVFWQAVDQIDPRGREEWGPVAARECNLTELFAKAGLNEVESTVLTVCSDFADFDEWWQTFTLGVGPPGSYVARLDARHRADLEAECAKLLPKSAFQITASAWTALARR